jgi:Bacterial PH domain
MGFNWFSVITSNTDLMDLSDPRILEAVDSNNLWQDEQIRFAFKYVRDIVVFTNHRLIKVDIQKVRGKKIRRTFYLWKHIEMLSVENAGGMLDGDHDINIKFKGLEEEFELQVKREYDFRPIANFLSNIHRQAN